VHPLVEAKLGEASGRGLMSFPSKSQADLDCIAGLEALLACTTQAICLQLPKAQLTVHFDPRLPAELLYYLALADYEQSGLEVAWQYVAPGERVMELGAGIGVTGCALARASGLPPILVEPNPVLWDHIEQNFKANRFGLHLIKGAAVPSSYSQSVVDFHVGENYWWSSLKPVDSCHRIEAPALTLSTLLNEHRPDVLSIDIEGAEDSFLEETLPDFVRKIFIKIHTPALGTRAACSVVTWLTANAFRLIDLRDHTWVFVR
jgi:FkbM family methyltransferase